MGPPPGPMALNLKQKQLFTFPVLPIPKRMLAWYKPKRKQASRTPNAAARFSSPPHTLTLRHGPRRRIARSVWSARSLLPLFHEPVKFAEEPYSRGTHLYKK